MRQVLLTICSLCCFFAWSQNFFPPIVNYSVKDYGKDRNPENYCVVQDQRGVMYFGNSHGVLEFDGEKWNYIQTGFGSFVRSLAVDKKGVVYVGVYGDFGYLAPDSTGQLTFISLLLKVPEEDQFFSNVWRIHATGNLVYFQTEEALFEYDSESKNINVIYPETSFHTSFLVDSTIYLRQREVGLVKYLNGQLVRLKSTEVVADYGVFGLHRMADDSLLIVTQELGLFKWANDSIRALPELNRQATSELGIFGSTELSSGAFALNTLSNGVVIIDGNGKIVGKIDRSTGIRSSVVHAVYQDRDLNLWLALENGLSKVNYHSPLSYYDEKNGIEGNVQAIIRFKGHIYAGTSFGLFRHTGLKQGSKQFENIEGIKEQVWDFCIADDILYVATANGLFRSSNGIAFSQITSKVANAIVYRQNRGDFIVGGAQGIFVYDKNFTEKWAYPNNFSTFLGGKVDPENDSVIWLGTTASNMIQLVENEVGFDIDFFGDESGLLDGIGQPIIFNDKLIFGGKEGLYKIESEEVRKAGLSAEELLDPLLYRITFEPYALHDSLFKGQIFLLEKGKTRTWYCNEFKIGFYDHQTKMFKNRPFWGIDYGRINEFYLEDDGVLWIGAAEGLIRYEKNNLKKYDSEFYSLIRKVSHIRGDTLFNGVFVNPQGEYVMEQDKGNIPELVYRNNNIEFLFSAPYFEDEHKPEYRYILEGNDGEWSEWQNKSAAAYNNLHEGDYTFRVEARNIYGQISQQATYSFTVLPPWYRTTWAFILYGIAFILVLLLGIRISSKRLKAKNVWLEGVVEERTKEISQKNVVLEHQKQEIQDSINYAQRIQEAILPLEEEMKRWIPKSFILFRPKDIVSGDFYWFLERDKKLVIICADCTGHGVPGAFMSMIGSDRLNNIVSENKITDPGAILSELNRAIKKSLKQDGQKNSTRDGMDAAVCTIDLTTNILKYAGANRPLWMIDAAGTTLSEIKATKVAVAGFTPDDQVYQEHQIALEPGLKFYLTTDGYADQFGSERNKKFKIANLKSLLIKNSLEPFNAQKETLERELLAWMGDFEQVDDVCIVGFEFQSTH